MSYTRRLVLSSALYSQPPSFPFNMEAICVDAILALLLAKCSGITLLHASLQMLNQDNIVSYTGIKIITYF